MVHLEPIPASHRQSEKELEQRFSDLRRQILGGLLDAVVCAICHIPYIQMQEKPRMADFAEWIVAAEPALPWPQNSFMREYTNNRLEATRTSLESDLMTKTIQLLMVQQQNWTGTASDLLIALNRLCPDRKTQTMAWPKSARALAGKLREIAPLLSTINYQMLFHRQANSGRRLITISRPNPDQSL
jgi:hypothetical protein